MGIHVPETHPNVAAAFPDVPASGGHPPPLMRLLIQDWNSPVKINRWLRPR